MRSPSRRRPGRTPYDPARRTPYALLLALAALALSAIVLSACGSDDKDQGGTTAAAAPTATVKDEIGDDWPLIGRDRDNSRYAPQTQITKENVAELGEAWSKDMGSGQKLQETYPLVVDGVMYATTSTDEVYAYDAATGAIKWKYVPKVDFAKSTGVGGKNIVVNRGVAVADGTVYLLTYDTNLKAISAATGEEQWSTAVDDPSTGAYETMAPTVYDGKVFVGNSGSDQGVRGFVAAYDAATGKKIWKFYTVPAKGHGWNKDGKAAGGTVYMAPTIDTVNNQVVVGTGNPSPAIVGKDRPGNNLYTSSVIALDVETGKLNWYNQQVAHDLWDYDAASPVVLFDTVIDGKKVRGVGEAGKSGWFFTMDAKTGKTLHPKVPFVTHQRKTPTKKGTLSCPGPLGGSTYAPVAWSPKTQAAYISGIEYCFILQVGPPQHGEDHFGGVRIVPPKSKPTGTFTAVDVSNGQQLWQKKIDVPMGGGATATATNIVFAGDIHGNLYAFDAENGAILWQKDLGLSIASAPTIYTVGDTQYLALAIGGSGLTNSTDKPLGPNGSRMVVLKVGGGPISEPTPFVEKQSSKKKQ